MQTKSQKPAEVTRQWYVIDASTMTLGRIASGAAKLLNGKHKATFTPHVDGGDYVVIINASKLKVTGKKELQKSYFRHSGYPGSTKEITLGALKERDATKIVTHAIRGMLPSNKLRPGKLNRLKVYLEEEHEHTAQKPKNYEVK